LECAGVPLDDQGPVGTQDPQHALLKRAPAGDFVRHDIERLKLD
jgi:hypothetical protein